MVLAVMVLFLVYRVYQVVNPPPPPVTDPLRPPGPEPPPGFEVPEVPSARELFEPADDWSGLTRRNLFSYRPNQGAQQQNAQDEEFQVNLTLLSIRETFPDSGEYKVQIRSASARKWYDVGESFESYQLESVDPDTQCCDVFSDNMGRVVTICIE